jgi:hypothetical protein
MLQRVRDQLIVKAEPDQFTAKLRPGGLFELEYMVSCLSVLACVENPALALKSYDELVEELARQHAGLSGALFCLRTLQLEIRLFGHDDMRFDELPEPVLRHLLSAMNCQNIQELVNEIGSALKTCDALINDFFSEIDWSKLPDWKETQVEWLRK